MRKIDLYTFVYNDEDMLPFFLNYYSFVNRMTFIDSGSNDRTLKILYKFATPSNPIIRIAQTGLTTWDHHKLHIYKNEIWKGSVYDLIFFPDCDEIFYRTDLIGFLNYTKNDIYEMEGYEMVSVRMPKIGENILNIKKGVQIKSYNKSTIFNPRIGISFPNAHLRYTQNTNISIGEIKLLHYRNLGIEQMKKRRDREKNRLPGNCKYRKAESDQWIMERYNDLMRNAKKVI